MTETKYEQIKAEHGKAYADALRTATHTGLPKYLREFFRIRAECLKEIKIALFK